MECQVATMEAPSVSWGFPGISASSSSFISHISIVYAFPLPSKMSTFRSVSLGFLPFYDFILCVCGIELLSELSSRRFYDHDGALNFITYQRGQKPPPAAPFAMCQMRNGMWGMGCEFRGGIARKSFKFWLTVNWLSVLTHGNLDTTMPSPPTSRTSR